MAIVNVLKFNENAGAMIADEEYWVWGRRRSFFTDHIYRISEGELGENLKMQLLYGGVGHPPFHNELTTHLQKRLNTFIVEGKADKIPTNTEQVGYLLLEAAQEAIQRRVNDHLQFLYGVTIDDVNRGFFKKDGKKYEINQASIKKELVNIVMQKGNNQFLKPLYKSRGVLMGIDQEFGFSAYYFNFDKSILAFNSGGFDAIGPGKYAAGITLGNYLNEINLHQRRENIDQIEGLFTLIHSAISAQAFKEVGGYFIIEILSQKDNVSPATVKTIHGHQAKLATEIVTAQLLEQIEKTTAFSLLERLIFNEEEFDKIEDELFTKAKSGKILEWRLAGFKRDVHVFAETSTKQKNDIMKSKNRAKKKNAKSTSTIK